MKKPATCLVCEAVGAIYRFKCCDRGFCSTACYIRHTECAGGVNTSTAGTYQRQVRADNFDLNVSEEDILTDDVMERVTSDPSISAFIDSPDLQRILIQTNQARDRRRTFSKLSATSPSFASFVSQLNAVLEGSNSVSHPA
jgi:hypothetical protein